MQLTYQQGHVLKSHKSICWQDGFTSKLLKMASRLHKFEHNLVMKAIVDTHNAQLGIVFKRGQDSKAVAGEAPEVESHEHISSATPTAAVPVAPYVYDPLASPASHASTSQLQPQPEKGAQLACPNPEEPTNQLELLLEEGGQLTFQTPREPLSQLDLHPEQGVHLLFNHAASLNLQPALQQEEELTSLAQPELQSHPEIKPSAVQRDAHEQSPPQEQATSSALESMGDITSLPRHVNVIMLKCVIKNTCGIGGVRISESLPLSQQRQIANTLLWRVATFDGLRTAHCRRSPAAWDSSRLLGFGKCWWPHQDTYLALHSRATKSVANVLRRNWHPSHWLWPTIGTNSGLSISKICSRSATMWVCGDSTQATKGKQSNRTSNMFGKLWSKRMNKAPCWHSADPNALSNLSLECEGHVADRQCFWHDSIEQAKHSIPAKLS